MHEIHKPQESDYDELTNLWEESVRATHHFLSEEDIRFFRPLVRNKYLQNCDLYCLRNSGGRITAFMGISGSNLEMLFVSPAQRGKGLGKRLIDFAFNQLGVDTVDVNEQNEQAVGFYYYMGFETVSRDEHDDMGKPFPILHLKKPRPEE